MSPVSHKDQEVVSFAEGNGVYGEYGSRRSIGGPAVFIEGGDLFGIFIEDDKLDKVTDVPLDSVGVRPRDSPGGTVFTEKSKKQVFMKKNVKKLRTLLQNQNAQGIGGAPQAAPAAPPQAG
jgi:hypothetical protein